MSIDKRCVELSKGTPFVFDRFDSISNKVYFYDGILLCCCQFRSFPPKSRGIKVAVNKTEAFSIEAVIRHGDRYSYDNVIYRSCDEQISVTCKVHGDFLTTPHMHLTDLHGCAKCHVENSRKSQDEILALCVERHGSRYTYDFSEYLGIIKVSKIKITCASHGVFEQTPYNHYSMGHGCPLCGRITQGGKSKSDHILTSQKNGGISWLYLIRCTGDNESFYKIGITVNGVNQRFSTRNLPYSYEVIREVKYISSDTWDFEKVLLARLRPHHYEPLLRFSGYSECFLDVEDVIFAFDSIPF